MLYLDIKVKSEVIPNSNCMSSNFHGGFPRFCRSPTKNFRELKGMLNETLLNCVSCEYLLCREAILFQGDTPIL